MYVTHTIQRALCGFRSLFQNPLKYSLSIHKLYQYFFTVTLLTVIAYIGRGYGAISAVVFIFNLRRFDYASSFRDEINILPMDEMFRVFSICIVHKYLSLNEPNGWL